MSSLIPGTCTGEKVYIEGNEIEDAVILSEGKGSSSGVVLLNEDKAFYIAKTIDDLKAIIDNLISAYGLIVSSMASNSPAPSVPLVLTDKITELTTLKGNLK